MTEAEILRQTLQQVTEERDSWQQHYDTEVKERAAAERRYMSVTLPALVAGALAIVAGSIWLLAAMLQHVTRL